MDVALSYFVIFLCLYGFINIFVIYFLLLLILILTTKVIFGHSSHIYQYFSGLGLWCLTPLLEIFQLYNGGQFIGGGNWCTWRKPQICHKLLKNFITYCCIGYTSSWTGFELTTVVVIDTGYKGKSNYHTMTTTTVPIFYRCIRTHVDRGIHFRAIFFLDYTMVISCPFSVCFNCSIDLQHITHLLKSLIVLRWHSLVCILKEARYVLKVMATKKNIN